MSINISPSLSTDDRLSPNGREENTGGRLAYSRLGVGEPLVLLHGQGLSRRSWDPVVTELARERDVIAVDLPGHGPK